jgi:hypothetical protein
METEILVFVVPTMLLLFFENCKKRYLVCRECGTKLWSKDMLSGIYKPIEMAYLSATQ